MASERKKAVKGLVGLAAGAALYAACPPAAMLLGGALFLKGARRFAQTGDINGARQMVMGYGDASGAASSTDANSPGAPTS